MRVKKNRKYVKIKFFDIKELATLRYQCPRYLGHRYLNIANPLISKNLILSL